MHGKVRLLAVHGHHLDGLACKSTNTPKVRGKVGTGSPGLPSEAAAAAAGGAEAADAPGAAAASAAAAAARRCFDRADRRAPASRSHFSESSSPVRRRDALLLHLSPNSRGRSGELSRELAGPPR